MAKRKRDPGTVEDGGWTVFSINTEDPVSYGPVSAPAEFDILVGPSLTKHRIFLTVAMDPQRGPVPIAIGPRWVRTSTDAADPVSYQELDAELREIDVDSLLNRAAARAIWMLSETQDDGVEPFDVRVERLRAAESLMGQRPLRRRAINTGHLAEVARVYREAAGSGTPTKAVAEAFQTSRSTAGRWVVQARARGLLGPSDSTRPGEVAERSE